MHNRRDEIVGVATDHAAKRHVMHVIVGREYRCRKQKGFGRTQHAEQKDHRRAKEFQASP
jgi:hypothetical protein